MRAWAQLRKVADPVGAPTTTDVEPQLLRQYYMHTCIQFYTQLFSVCYYSSEISSSACSETVEQSKDNTKPKIA